MTRFAACDVRPLRSGGRIQAQVVVRLGDGSRVRRRVNACLEMAGSLQFAATTTRTICRLFQLLALGCSFFGRTFNPKVARSNLARRHLIERHNRGTREAPVVVIGVT